MQDMTKTYVHQEKELSIISVKQYYNFTRYFNSLKPWRYNSSGAEFTTTQVTTSRSNDLNT